MKTRSTNLRAVTQQVVCISWGTLQQKKGAILTVGLQPRRLSDFSSRFSLLKDDLICFHVFHFFKEISFDNSAHVTGTENHIVGGPKESGMVTIEDLTGIWFPTILIRIGK